MPFPPCSRTLLLSLLVLAVVVPAVQADADLPRHRYAVAIGPSVGRVMTWGITTAGTALELSGGTQTEIALRVDLHPVVSGQPGHLLGGVQGVVRRFLRKWPGRDQQAVDPYLGIAVGSFFGNACSNENACGGLAPRMDLELGLRLNLAEHWDLQFAARAGVQGPARSGFERAFLPTLGIMLRWRSGARDTNAR